MLHLLSLRHFFGAVFVDPNQQTVTPQPEAGQPRYPSRQRGDTSWKVYSDQWNENHGTFLMIFAAGILLTGLAILSFQQSRFRKPAFPSYQSIERASDVPFAGVFDGTEVDEDALMGGPTFRLRIVGASADEDSGGGTIRIAAYSASEQFNQPEFAIWKRSIAIPPEGDAVSLIAVDQLPASFAIAAFQDVNENGELDTNMFGVPVERYGFGNDARGTIGPPPYDDAVVEHPGTDGELTVTIQ